MGIPRHIPHLYSNTRVFAHPKAGRRFVFSDANLNIHFLYQREIIVF